jgi:hypothetical protein
VAAGVDRMVLQSMATTNLDEALEEMSSFATSIGLPSGP